MLKGKKRRENKDYKKDYYKVLQRDHCRSSISLCKARCLLGSQSFGGPWNPNPQKKPFLGDFLTGVVL